MDTVDEVTGAQNVSLTRGRCAAADVDGGDSAGRAKDDGAAGGGAKIGPMADEQTLYGGNSGDFGRFCIHFVCWRVLTVRRGKRA